MDLVLSRAIVPTPLGDMLALASDTGLCALEFTGPGERLTRLEARLRHHFPRHTIIDCDAPAIARTRAWLRAYFEGTRVDAAAIPLDMRGATFECRVWTALRE